jgi:hypothetical protein
VGHAYADRSTPHPNVEEHDVRMSHPPCWIDSSREREAALAPGACYRERLQDDLKHYAVAVGAGVVGAAVFRRAVQVLLFFV